MSLLRIRQPKTRKGRKALQNREPKTIEDIKNTLFIEGRKCAGDVKVALKDFYHFKKPHCKVLKRNNDITPFDDAAPIEFLTERNNSSLFMFGSSSKKRPNNLIIGRMYELQLLDMVEFHIKQYKGLQEFKIDKIGTMVKPAIIFNGFKWKLTDELRRIKSLFLDLFHKDDIPTIRLQGIEHVISFTVTEDLTIMMRSYKIQLKKSGQRTPRIELTEIGPSMDLVIRRTKLASKDLFKVSMRRPAILRVAKRKNVTRDELGNVHGRVHVGKQDINKLQTRKMKGLKKTGEERRKEKSLKDGDSTMNDDDNDDEYEEYTSADDGDGDGEAMDDYDDDDN